MLSNLIFRISNLEWTFWTFVCCQRDLMYLESLIIAHIKYIFWQARSIGGGGGFLFFMILRENFSFLCLCRFFGWGCTPPHPRFKKRCYTACLIAWSELFHTSTFFSYYFTTRFQQDLISKDYNILHMIKNVYKLILKLK